MKKMMMTLVALLTMTVAFAQNESGRQQAKMDAATFTEMMVKKLGLDSKQQKKLQTLNKKYESVLGGPGMGGQRPSRQNGEGGSDRGSRPEMTDAQKSEMKQRREQRQAYEKELKGILSDDQYKSYQQMMPQRGHRGNGQQGENR